MDVTPLYRGRRHALSEFLQPASQVPEQFFVRSRKALSAWKYLKGPKRERRMDRKTGFEYFYTEGGIPFPDAVNEPARTILTGEGGSTPSRFKHIVRTDEGGRYRRLTPVELERLNGFPDGWTSTGMSDGQRAFCMGNALVVGVVERIAREVSRRAEGAVASRTRRATKSLGSR
jgi:DNA (cytosine-5)-methyltransferase 1